MSQDEDICYEERDGIAIVTLNRPAKKNALTDQMVGGVANSVGRENTMKRSPYCLGVTINMKKLP